MLLHRLKRYFIILIILSLFSSVVNAQNHINPNDVGRDDQYTYDYFNNFLKEFADILQEIVFDNPNYLNDSKNVFRKVDITRNEILIYEAHNIESPSKYVIDPFYKFSKELMYLSELDKKLKDDLSENSTNSLFDAKLKIIEINKTIGNMEIALDEIDNTSVLKKGNETLKFNTSDVRKYLELYKDKVSRYENILRNITMLGLIIDVSNKNPILFENISIYGIGKDGNLTIHIENGENKTFNITVKNHSFSMNYAFDKVGIYKVYATQNNKTSNIVYVNVSKIPSYIVVNSRYEGFVGKNITINGKLIDYYGNPIKNTTIYANGNIVKVDNNGRFTIIEFSSKSITKQINLVFKGNEIYEKSNKTIEVAFLKYPVRIVITTNKNNISIKEPLTIYGKVYGLKKASNIDILVNGTIYKVIKTNGTFETNITFNSSGDYEIYAIYKGDEYYESCKSNIIKIHVEGSSIIPFIILGLIFVLVIGYCGYRLIKSKKSKKDTNKEIKKEIIDENRIIQEDELDNKDKENIVENIPEDIREAYNYLFNKLVSKYKLPNNLTPRELLNIVKDKDYRLYEDLEFVTKIHENVVYGKWEDINLDVKNVFFKKLKKILEEV